MTADLAFNALKIISIPYGFAEKWLTARKTFPAEPSVSRVLKFSGLV